MKLLNSKISLPKLSIYKVLLLFCASSLFFSCSQKPAKIVNRSKAVYSKNNQFNRDKYRNSDAVIEKESLPQKSEIQVVAGETLFSLSKKYKVSLRDLIQANNLNPPYSLRANDRLKIPTPTYHKVKKGETLYTISRNYNMKVDQLIELNDIKKPYSVSVGNKIRVINSDENSVAKTNDKNSAAVSEKQNVDEKSLEEQSQKPKNLGIVDKTLNQVSNFSGHFAWPLRGKIISGFGPKKGGLYNDGINIKAKEGSQVKASEEGLVAYVGNELKGYGNLIIVKHSNNWITAYAHLKESSVKRGQKVNKGQVIGTVGATGNVNSSQLYFGLRKGRDAVDPQNYLPK